MTTTQWVGPADDPDRYQLTELRSRGGEGELWVGWVTVESQQLPAAVKVFHPSASLPLQELANRVRGQAEILRSLDHPNLVKVREAFLGSAPHERGAADPSSQVLYLTMNWVNGENLEGWVARHPQRDVLQCTRIVSRVAAAVDEIHRGRSTQGASVLHRDIKPANVIVNDDEVRLVDFGLARFATGEYPTIAGTPAYLAPEVLAGAQPSEASDRFGVGAVTYFLFTGAAPDLTNQAEMRARLHDVRGVVDRDGFVDHVMAMVDRDPSRRPANVVEWAQGLAVGAVSQRFDTPRPPARRGSGRRAVLVGGAMLLALVAGGFTAFLLTRDGDDDRGDEDSEDVAEVGDETTTTATEDPDEVEVTTTDDLDTSEELDTTTSTEEPTDPGAIEAPDSIQYLADFEPVFSDVEYWETGQGRLSGEVYTRSLMLEPFEQGFVEYDLGRNYASLEGQLGLRDDVPSGTAMQIQLYADGEELLNETVELGDAVPFELDVGDVLRLRVQVTNLSEDTFDGGFAILADPRLVP